jgi:peptidoglycan/LPS O-acetylase OafA/YrhL
MTFPSNAAETGIAEPDAAAITQPWPFWRSLLAALAMPGAFRLFLASAVVVNHYTKLQVGTAAVDLFFILSGYWIERMYGKQYAPRRRPAFVFISSRVMRLMPMFLLFSISAILLQNALHTDVALDHFGFDILPNFIILGYASLAKGPLVPAWSLDIELQFYLLFPLFWRVIPRNKTVLLWITLLLIGAGAIYLGTILREQSRTVLPYLGFFTLGLYASRARIIPSALAVRIGCALALLLVIGSLAWPLLRGLFYAMDGLPAREWKTLANIALALCLAPLAISTLTRKSTTIDRTLGDLSYAVYCSHWIGVTLAGYYLVDAGWRLKLPCVMALLVITYLASFAALLWFDRPLSRLREAWIRRQPLKSTNTG